MQYPYLFLYHHLYKDFDLNLSNLIYKTDSEWNI